MPALLRSVLLAEGNTDVALCRILTWLLMQYVQYWDADNTILVSADDLAGIPKGNLAARMRRAYDAYSYEILFVHRDADADDPKPRHDEIERAYQKVQASIPTCIAVVPVQETESWLLFNEAAIRQAAGHPKGRVPLNLPRMKAIEKMRDPKEHLYNLLEKASIHHGKPQHAFRSDQAAQDVADNITDFAPLRALKAFQTLEQAVKAAIQAQHW